MLPEKKGAFAAENERKNDGKLHLPELETAGAFLGIPPLLRLTFIFTNVCIWIVYKLHTIVNRYNQFNFLS
jgi:hypothetical protein